MNPREWWLRLGDRNIVTKWSWILTLPFAVTVMANYYLCTGVREVGVMAVGAFATHCVVGVMLLMARAVLAAHRSQLAALALFAVIGAIRPFVLDAITRALELPVDPRPMLVRVALNVACSVVFLSLTAVLVSALRDRLALQRSLKVAGAAVQLQQTRDRFRLDQTRAQCRRELERSIETVMHAVAETELEGVRGAALLKRISDDVVRPMSHRLFREIPPIESPTPTVRLTARDRLIGVVRSVEPAPLYVPVFAYTALVTVYLLTTYGVTFTAVQLGVGFWLFVGGNACARRVVSSGDGPLRRIATLSAVYCSSALISSTATWLLLTVFGRTPTFYLSSMAVYPLVALSVCLIRAADTQRQDEERQLRSALSRQALDAARIHAELMHTRRGLARLLHSSVQGELVAAAWSSGAVAGRPVDVAATIAHILDGLESDLSASSDQPADSDARKRIDDLVTVWRYAIPVVSHVDDEVWAVIGSGSARLDSVVEILSEGLTNAVKHGAGGPVFLEVTLADARAVVVRISSPGRMPVARDSGIGLESLAGTVTSLELVEEEDRVVLTAVLL
ncbi:MULTISPECIES: two-component system, sensor protein [Rhodococcus]|uniref:two-component system, sensor protein n=1 Tax=Rhodococcus TaxID=1827 RepID=UPI00130329A2|nr:MULTISPECIES: two-component system, sensor protein [unclassified Rhodococcus (in: high G+C Gram-positive bacteria)]WEX05848.1 two-component system, sensor protein [Rhodococcus sp. RCBS9]